MPKKFDRSFIDHQSNTVSDHDAFILVMEFNDAETAQPAALRRRHRGPASLGH
jgi:hypothetical protein